MALSGIGVGICNDFISRRNNSIAVALKPLANLPPIIRGIEAQHPERDRD
jgi:hypothetical protein